MAARQVQHHGSSALRRRRGAKRGAVVSAVRVQHVLYFLVGMTLFAAFVLVLFLLTSNISHNNTTFIQGSSILRRRHVKKVIIPNVDNVHNSLAQDIINSLECESLQNPKLMRNNDDPNLEDEDEDDDKNPRRRRRRRLDQGMDDFDLNDDKQQQQQQAPLMDDDVHIPMSDGETTSLNAKHAMCLVAGSPNLPSFIRKEGFSCDLMDKDKRQALLDTWSSARTQMSLSLIAKTLEMAQETSATILGHDFNIWMPAQDSSLEFLSNTLNDEESSRILRHLPLADPNSLFVDVGSGLGLTTLTVAKEYPATHILSIEPASPSWLLQQLNLICNLVQHDRATPVLAGVGASPRLPHGMAKVLWRPSQTRLTRTWTSRNETSPDDDLELVIHLRRLWSIVAEYVADNNLQDVNKITTRVLNLDCEGCEYNVVPSMSQTEELDYYTHLIGTTGVHWGYIPVDKLPSSKRAETTHKILCGHYDYARQSIECCAFPTLSVKGIFNQQEKLTVQDVAGDLCRGFDEFAETKLLFASNDDYGWMELSSKSDAVVDEK
jgi:FkbM family methyltransferase